MYINREIGPTTKVDTYLKYGFVLTEHEFHSCPRCGSVLNAGPNYQPKVCEQCGQRITFKGIVWKEDKTIGYAPIGKEGDTYA